MVTFSSSISSLKILTTLRAVDVSASVGSSFDYLRFVQSPGSHTHCSRRARSARGSPVFQTHHVKAPVALSEVPLYPVRRRYSTFSWALIIGRRHGLEHEVCGLPARQAAPFLHLSYINAVKYDLTLGSVVRAPRIFMSEVSGAAFTFNMVSPPSGISHQCP